MSVIFPFGRDTLTRKAGNALVWCAITHLSLKCLRQYASSSWPIRYPVKLIRVITLPLAWANSLNFAFSTKAGLWVISKVTEKIAPDVAYLIFTPLKKTSFRSPQVLRARSPHYLRQVTLGLLGDGATPIELETKDGRKIDAVFAPAQYKSRATIILSHPNGTTLDEMAPLAAQIRTEYGFNVLLKSVGGYPSCCDYNDPDPERGGLYELKQYAEVEAAYQFAMTQGDKVGWIGYSWGGAHAAAGAGMHPGTSCLLINTFDSIRGIGEHTLHGMQEQNVYMKHFLPRAQIEAVLSGLFPLGKKDDRYGDFETNGFDNVQWLEKAGRDTNTMVLYGEKDHLMSPEMSERMDKACNALKFRLNGTGHMFDPARHTGFEDNLNLWLLGISKS